MNFDLKLTLTAAALLYSLSSPLHAMEDDVSELFEGDRGFGSFHVKMAEASLKFTPDAQFKKLAIQASKIAFPDNSGSRAEFLNCLVKNYLSEEGSIKSSEDLRLFVSSLEEKKKEYYKLRFCPRMDKLKRLLGEESAVPNLKIEELPDRILEPIGTRMILQSEVSIAAQDDKEKVLTTFGVGPCAALGIYNPRLKKVGLAHCGTSTLPEELKFVYRVCEDEDKNKVKIYLLSSDQEHLTERYVQLTKLGFSDHVFIIIKTPFDLASAVGIDSKDGSFFSFNASHHLLNEMRPDLQSMDFSAVEHKTTLTFVPPTDHSLGIAPSNIDQCNLNGDPYCKLNENPYCKLQ